MSGDKEVWLKIEPKKIIIKMPNWIGDLVMATPILQDVRNKWKGATIVAMCQANIADLLKNNPYIDEVYSYKKLSGWIRKSQPSNIIDSLKKGDYDLGILLTNSFSSALWFWRGGVKNRIGFKTFMRSLLLNKSVPFPENIEKQHLVKTYKSLLIPLGIPISASIPKLYLTEKEKERASMILSNNGMKKKKSTLIGINPGAAYGSAKCWPPKYFRALTEKLLKETSLNIIFFGDEKTTELIHQIVRNLGPRIINLSGKTNLRELIALIQLCDVLLTNDSGPMHIASALKVPLVALFGSTSPIKTGPYGNGVVMSKEVECSPCYKRVCPIDFRCMKKLSVDEVYSTLTNIIKKDGDEL